jgi:Ca2+-binding RTX toxin-like protein
MAGVLVSTALTTTYTTNTNDTYYFSRGASVLVATGNAVESATTTSIGETIRVAGELGSGDGSGLALFGRQDSADVTSTGNHSVVIEATGSVSGRYGASLSGSFNTFQNDGSVTGDFSGLKVTGPYLKMVNTGLIQGWTGFELGDGGTGLPSAAAVIQNSGTISGISNGIRATFASSNIVNTGTILSGDVGIYVSGGDSVANIRNYGSISGGVSSSGRAIETGNNNDVIKNFGTLSGLVFTSRGDDVIKNGGLIDGDVVLFDGADVFKGSSGSQVTGYVDGGAGDDILKGGNNDDTLLGGAGVDILKGRGGNDTLTDTSGNDSFWGGSGNDVMNAGAGANKMYGGTGDDTINAGSGSDLVKGGNGNDTITGGNGKDKLYGNDGNDVINGGGKADTIYGGGGNDTMTGSSGADVFVFTQRAGDDVITDFTNNSDKMDLSGFGISSAAAIVSAASAVTGGTLIDLDLLGGNGSIFLAGFNAADLDATDFIL